LHRAGDETAGQALHRAILASGGAQWGPQLGYPCGQVITVAARYTSQTCSGCSFVTRANHTS